MADLSRDELHRLARLGAQARLDEIKREEAAIRKAFPELFRAASRPLAQRAHAPAAAVAAPRRRSSMSAAMRKAVSERMTRYWANRRKARQAGEAEPATAAKPAKAPRRSRKRR